MAKLAIIGGGIIGLACAYYWRKQNQEVVLIDKGNPGEGPSRCNMGWVSPTLSGPLPGPGMIGTSMKWLFKKDSPLYIKPRAVPFLAPWLIQFMRYCNEQKYQLACDAGFDISKDTFQLFDELVDDGVEFEMHRKGLLVLGSSESDLQYKYDDFKQVERIGLPRPELVTGAELVKMEPHMKSNLAGALFLPQERHVRPESMVNGLVDWLRNNGVEMKINDAVTDIVHNHGRVERVKCNTGWVEADMFLLAAGAWSSQLMKKLNYSLPIVAGKGYSITYQSPNVEFNHPIYFAKDKAALTPFDGALRIGGTMELSGINDEVMMNRVNGIKNSVAKFLSKEIHGSGEVILSGMRPMTPDSLPVLGGLPNFKNVFVAAGHGGNGLLMSLSTGRILSDVMSGRDPGLDVTPFSPQRFK